MNVKTAEPAIVINGQKIPFRTGQLVASIHQQAITKTIEITDRNNRRGKIPIRHYLAVHPKDIQDAIVIIKKIVKRGLK